MPKFVTANYLQLNENFQFIAAILNGELQEKFVRFVDHYQELRFVTVIKTFRCKTI